MVMDFYIENYPTDVKIPLSVDYNGIRYGVTSIDKDAFFEKENIKSVSIPSSITEIGEGAFGGCKSLNSIWVDKGNIIYCSEDGVLFNKDKTVLIQYPIGNGKISYIVPDTVETIDSYAFDGSFTLSRLFMYGNNLNIICPNAFRNCDKLEEVTIPECVNHISEKAFTCKFYDSGIELKGNQLAGLSFLKEEGKLQKQEHIFNVFYDVNGGSGTIESYHCDDPEITLPDHPGEKEGCAFLGWESNGELYEAGRVVRVDEGVGFKAIWADAKLTFDSNGGPVCPEPMPAVIGKPYGEYGELPVIEWEGYVFTGWFTSAEGGNKVDENTICKSSDLTVYAHWATSPTLNIVIEFNGNGGEPSEDMRILKAGSQIGNLPTATKEGHVFIGWFTEKEGGVQVTSESKFYTNTTIYAHWNDPATDITITFDGNGGTPSVPSRNIPAGSAIGDLPTATREGFELVGWFTSAEGGEQVTPDMTFDDGTTIYAHWKVPTVYITIIFDGNGGTPSVPSRNIPAGSAIGDLPTATREGFELVGWFTSAEGGEQVTPDMTFDDGTTIYAHWKVPTVYITIIFDGNGGTPSVPSRNIPAGSAIGDLPTATREGFELVGWFTSAEGGEQVTPDMTFDDGTTIYAHWKVPTVYITIIFDGNGGTPSVPSRSIPVGTEIGNLPTATREGFELVGWFTSAEGGEQVTPDMTFDDGTTIYAHWKVPTTEITITFDGNGGTPSESSRSIDAGAAIRDLPTATREGYKFVGWFTEKEGGNKVDENTTFDKNCTLYAHWEQNGNGNNDSFPIVPVAIGILSAAVLAGVGIYYLRAKKQ